MERSRPTSGRPATPADINRNGRPTSIGTGGRLQSECPADIVGIRSQAAIFTLTRDIVGEARLVEGAFGLGPCALTEAIQLLGERLEAV